MPTVATAVRSCFGDAEEWSPSWIQAAIPDSAEVKTVPHLREDARPGLRMKENKVTPTIYSLGAFAQRHTWILDMNTVLRCCIYHLFHDWLDPSSASVWSDENSKGGTFSFSESENQAWLVSRWVCGEAPVSQLWGSLRRTRPGVRPSTTRARRASLGRVLPVEPTLPGPTTIWMIDGSPLAVVGSKRKRSTEPTTATNREGNAREGEVDSPARSQWCPAFCFQAVRSVQLYSCQWTSRVAGDLAGTSVITQHALGWLLRHVKSRGWLPVCLKKNVFQRAPYFHLQHGKKEMLPRQRG